MRPLLCLLVVLLLGGCARQETVEPDEFTRLQQDMEAVESQIRKDRRILEQNDENRMPWTSIAAELASAQRERNHSRYRYNSLPGDLAELSGRIVERERALAKRQRDYDEAQTRIEYNERAKNRLEERLETLKKAEVQKQSKATQSHAEAAR